MAAVVAVAKAVMVVMAVDSQGLLLSPPLTYVFCWRGWMGHGSPRTGGEYDCGAAWQCPCGCCNTQLPKGVRSHQCLRARKVAIVVHLDCHPSEPCCFPFSHNARA